MRVTAEYVEGLFRKIRDLEFEVQSLKDKYQRDVFGLNNEGDPIGGDPAGGYANDLARLKTDNEYLLKDAGRLDWILKNCDLGGPPYLDSREEIDEEMAAYAISSPENPS